MKKDSITVPDIFVRKISERMGKVLTKGHLQKLWMQSGGSKSRLDYGIMRAKATGSLSMLGGGLYFSGILSNIEDIYWQLVPVLIEEVSPSGAIIAHEKSMECHLRNYEVPQRLVLYTRDTSRRVQVGDYEFHFRTLKTGPKTGSKNIYHILARMSQIVKIDGIGLIGLGLEASLLDVASLRTHENGIAEDLILRFLTKYEKSLSREHLGELLEYRYIRSANRLRSLGRDHGYEQLYNMMLDIIKKEGGGCYVSL